MEIFPGPIISNKFRITIEIFETDVRAYKLDNEARTLALLYNLTEGNVKELFDLHESTFNTPAVLDIYNRMDEVMITKKFILLPKPNVIFAGDYGEDNPGFAWVVFKF